MKKLLILFILLITLSSNDELSSQNMPLEFISGSWSMTHGVITPLCERNEIELTLKIKNTTGSTQNIEFIIHYQSVYVEPLEVNGVDSYVIENLPDVSRIIATATIPTSSVNQPFHELITLKFFVKLFPPDKPSEATIDYISTTDLATNTTTVENNNNSVWSMLNVFPDDHISAFTIRSPYLLFTTNKQ